MKNIKGILLRLETKRYIRGLRSRKRKKNRRRQITQDFYLLKKNLNNDFSYENLKEKWFPKNLKYLLNRGKCSLYKKSQLFYSKEVGVFTVPKHFSLVDSPEQSYELISSFTSALIDQKYKKIYLDYKQCEKVDLGTQVYLDIILKDFFSFSDRCDRHPRTRLYTNELGGINISNIDVNKLLFSVGSSAIHIKKTTQFQDIIPYKLRIHDASTKSTLQNLEQKDIDTTELVDYVITCLKRVNKKLTGEKLDDLCTVIGEILINAEEHSTTNCRYSIGYFHDIPDDNKHYGIFRLAILNFGDTIYEKFKDKNCQNKEIVNKMKNLSNKYTERNYFLGSQFEEETLWTLYALQEGVTSVDPRKYKKRGNGSIRFIESFFNIKGVAEDDDKTSKMTILSGNTCIVFNGKYNIQRKVINDDEYKVMTFNDSGNIEDKPDKEYVKFVKNYFPGTMISAEILFDEGDIEND